MAMKFLLRRFLQYFDRNTLLLRSHFLNDEASCQLSSCSTKIPERYTKLIRGIQTQSEASIQSTEVAAEAEGRSTVDAISELKVEAVKAKSEFSVHTSAMSNLKVSSRHDLAMVFTCKVCETRSVKTCCRESYENGVVVVRCGGCNNLHLMADRLGWFGEPGSVEDLLAARGDDVKRGGIDSLNLTLEDLAGKKL
ncbi:hypothetical protein RND81_13G150600 [Saponaria officinalis]|uniref:DNL-type domain-containing protein n=1 Tax=Saponaria officinalis TaxID=3572 RepID=A0AAW1H052_SAPOF